MSVRTMRIFAAAVLSAAAITGPAIAAGSIRAESEALYARTIAMAAQMPHTVAQQNVEGQNPHSVYYTYTDALKTYSDRDLPQAQQSGQIDIIGGLELIQVGNWLGNSFQASHMRCDHLGALLSLKVARVYLDDFEAGSPHMRDPKQDWVVPGKAAATANMLGAKNLCIH